MSGGTPSARPNFWQWDLGVNKNFRITERAPPAIPVGVFQRSESHELRHPGLGYHDAAFGTIRSTFPARQIQFALKLMF